MQRGKQRVTCFPKFKKTKKQKRLAKSRHGPTVFKSRAVIESTGRDAIKFRASESSGSCSDTKTSSPGTGRSNQKAISGRPRATETECSSEVPHFPTRRGTQCTTTVLCVAFNHERLRPKLVSFDH